MNDAADSPQDDPSATTGDDNPPLPPEPSPSLVKIGRYRIVKVLGEGSFGRVYLARDDQLDRPVAIKVPRQPLARPADVEVYLAEARVVAGLDHPNIVPVHDVGTTSDGLPFVVSKLVEGSDLDCKMRETRLTQLAAAELVKTVAEALHYAHRHRLVHRDIKPANILIDAAGQPHVADFGIALKENQFGKGARFVGTPAYMSPEQARGEGHRVDGRSDVFSLGVVFYELLTGRRPFEGESQTELLEQIKTADARPPRQFDDAIAKELERICLKALARKASERYTTAKDFADDLRLFLAQAPAASASAPPLAPMPQPTTGQTATPPLAPADTGSDPRPLKIVPKGLRSFDARDADFFLELLPGPRDRDGLPDSIRFWKNKIEETDPDNTFSVGLIYGPSGCGKSSLVKAGLLPRLSADVITVYLEATAADTEARLLNGLRKRCPALPAACGLAESLAQLRQGTAIPVDKKVLIVLDQFEQWLHGSFSQGAQRSEELISSLRQCDGRHIQCIVMVRDDFWMAATRFMQELEIRLVEGHNSAAVDLFPAAHAEKVLAAFGRAFGVLPERAGDLNKDQRRFLEQTVAALAQEGKVICVRLALLAEMMKGKPWTPAALKAVGGAEGVGVTFLEETFSAAGAPPEHRYHQNAARAVLRALLPESGTAIKGHMRSIDELLAVSGYARRPKEFDDLVRILDGDVRLITPTDTQAGEGGEELARRFAADMPLGVARPERSEGRDGVGSDRTPLAQGSAAPADASRGVPHSSEGRGSVSEASTPLGQGSAAPSDTSRGVPHSSEGRGSVSEASTPLGQGSAAPPDTSRGVPHGRFYQLTHDYLVPSLRDWLTRKQKETRRGRAELRLAERAALWTAKPQSRHLPAWWEWINIRALTRKKDWTPPQRKMMRKGARFHAVRGTALALMLAAAVMAGLYVRDEVVQQNKESHAKALVERLLDAKIGQVPGIVAEIEPFRRWADPLLKQEHEKAAAKSPRKLHTSLALLPVDEEQVDYLYERLLSAEPQDINVLVGALTKHKEKLLDKLWASAQQPSKDTERLPAAVALASYDPLSGNWDKVRDQAAGDLVAVDAVYLATWLDGLRDVREKLLPPLAAVFRDGKRSEPERALATEILVDYAGDKPALLTDLLLDAADKQYFKLYGKLKEHGQAALAALERELARPANAFVLKREGTIAADDPKVKVKDGKTDRVLAAKVFAVPLEAGQTYTMTMSSTELDSFLVVQDQTGKQLAFDDDSGGGLDAMLHYTPPQSGTYQVHAASLDKTGSFLLTIVDPGLKEGLAKRQANAGVALLKLGQADKVWPLLKHSPDPRARTYLMHYLSPLGVEARALVKRFDEEPDVDIRRALILTLGEFADKDLQGGERAALVGKLQDLYRTAADPGLRAAAEWLLRQWNHGDWLVKTDEEWPRDKETRDEREDQIREELAKAREQAKPCWYVNGQGQTMVVLPGPKEFLMGSPFDELGRLKGEIQHTKKIARTFAIAAKPVTVKQYRKFFPKYAVSEDYARTEDCPVHWISWHMAAQYCNLLSKEEGIDKEQWCYDIDGKGNVAMKPDFLKLTGYRLPTEAEWECACRAEPVTSRYYGETDLLLGKYAVYLSSSENRSWPVGSKKPNDWGLFDMHGNVLVWCQEEYVEYAKSKVGTIEDKEQMFPITNNSRVLRGGSFLYQGVVVRSADRLWTAPTSRNYANGVRPARTFH